MTLREAVQRLLWTLTLAVLPWSPLVLMPYFSPWQAQAMWAQGWIIVLTGVWIASQARPIQNRAVGTWLTMVCLVALMAWGEVMIRHKVYPAIRLMGVSHFLLLVLFYLAATALLRPGTIAWLCRALAWSGALMVAYGYLQWANLDPLFKNMDWGAPDAVVGMIGNGTHFGTYLALLLPFFLARKGWGWIGCWLAALVLIAFTHSSTAYLMAFVLSVGMWWGKSRRVASWLLGVGLLVGVVAVAVHPRLLNLEGRWEAWTAFGRYANYNAVLGVGLGAVYDISSTIEKTSPIYQWRHVHNEYYQLFIEQGFLGVGCFVGLVWSLTRRLRRLAWTWTQRTCAWVLVGFGLCSLTSYPAHLWALGSLALFSYCSLIVLTEPI